MTVFGQSSGGLSCHWKVIFNDQDFHKFIGNTGSLEADGKLCSE